MSKQSFMAQPGTIKKAIQAAEDRLMVLWRHDDFLKQRATNDLSRAEGIKHQESIIKTLNARLAERLA